MGLARRIPIPVCLVAIALGIVVLAGDAVATAAYFAAFVRDVRLVTVPAAVDLDLPADAPEQVVWREYQGQRQTANRPLLGVPDDLAVTVTDRRTGEAVETRDALWSQRLRIMDLGVARHAVRSFTPPPHGEISVEVTGGFDYEQVYAVGPTPRAWGAYAGDALLAVALAGTLLIVLALAALGARALSAAAEPSLDAE